MPAAAPAELKVILRGVRRNGGPVSVGGRVRGQGRQEVSLTKMVENALVCSIEVDGLTVL